MNAFLRITTMGLFAMLAAPLGCGSDVDDGSGGSAASGTGSGAAGSGAATGTGGGGGDPSAGGHGGTGAVSVGGSGAQGGSGGGACDGLFQAFDEAFQAAIACNACMGAEPCLAGPKIFDACGCEVGANGLLPDEVAEAQKTYEVWVAAGCGPHECGKECPAGGQQWTCMPTGGGCDGACNFF